MTSKPKPEEGPPITVTSTTADLLSGLGRLYPNAAMFMVDAERTVQHWSDQAEALLGYPREEVLGQHCRMISRCQECMVGCPISESNAGIQLETTLYTRAGEPIALERVGIALRDEAGEFSGGIEFLHPQKPHESNAADHTAHPTDADGGGFFAVSAPTDALPFGVPPVDSRESDTPAPVEERAPHLYNRAALEDESFARLGELVTRDLRMKNVLGTIHRIAETDASVLLQGESGTGKELVARAIHSSSPRHGGPFVAVNCAALTPTLLESELFGHAKGAFTGAVARRIGLFQRAEKGTIFLDEIAELPLDLQSKLLRVLEEREVIPVGSTTPIKVNIRVLSASYKSLPKEAEAGNFREDLMYRLRVVPIQLPPLRRRPEDIPLLLWHFIHLFNEFGPRHITQVAASAMDRVCAYTWPGNVRELKNATEYAFAIGRGSTLLASELPEDLQSAQNPALPNESTPLPQAIAHIPDRASGEKEQIVQALATTHGHVGQAAELLGMSRPTLWRKRKKHGI